MGCRLLLLKPRFLQVLEVFLAWLFQSVDPPSASDLTTMKEFYEETQKLITPAEAQILLKSFATADRKDMTSAEKDVLLEWMAFLTRRTFGPEKRPCELEVEPPLS